MINKTRIKCDFSNIIDFFKGNKYNTSSYLIIAKITLSCFCFRYFFIYPNSENKSLYVFCGCLFV